MKRIALLISLLALAVFTFAQTKYPLWEDNIPNYQESDDQESITPGRNITFIRNVQKPEIEVYLPSPRNANGMAVVICPGGGYSGVAYDWEGTEVAKWLNTHGIAGIVLKYRMPGAKSNIIRHISPLMDAQRAMRYTRHHAKEWNIDPEKVGVMGFSAGGHLASTLGVHYDKGWKETDDPIDQLSARPDFMILMYPVISMTDNSMHKGSRNNLLGPDLDPALAEYFSTEKQVHKDTPPTILIHSGDDKGVPVKNSLMFYEALLAHEVPAEMHIYPFGGHGFGLALDQGYLSTWTDRCVDWLMKL